MHGSPSKLKARTFRVAFRLPVDETPHRAKARPTSRVYRNPVIMAQEWQQALDSGEHRTQAEFA
jgi:hypothetical protein